MTPAELRQIEPMLERVVERAVYAALERQRKEEVERDESRRLVSYELAYAAMRGDKKDES